MSRAPVFQRHGDGVRMRLQAFEVELLREAHAGLSAALSGGDADNAVRQRLFPATVQGDEDADDELRRLIFDDLLERRRDGLAALRAILERATEHRGELSADLVEDEPLLVLGMLNDLRLAVGARIGIDRLDRDALAKRDPRWRAVAIIDHFAWMQEQLLSIIDPVAAAVYEDEAP